MKRNLEFLREEESKRKRSLRISIAGMAISVISILTIFVIMIVKGVTFSAGCTGHLERASNATNIELATQELDVALDYLEKRGMTSGYTSILWRTPDEDIGFWYNNIKEANLELKNTPDTISNLEESNMLIKLRETLMESSGKGDSAIICPDGLSRYPNNLLFAIILNLSWVLLVIFFLRTLWKLS